ncbi:MAG: glycoside hydrolase family 3 protein [Gemmatimonadaceae bacterium]|nr:glycoside hydrolase family 3 protein [Gemmatimonadaceae bacterium]
MPAFPETPAMTALIDRLLSRMSTAQKVGQLVMAERASTTPDDVRSHHLGAVLSGGGSVPGSNQPADWVAMHDAYWAASMDASGDRVPVPVLYAVDAVHGHGNVLGATIFPHNIGLGAMRDPELVEQLAKVCAREVLATGVEWTFAPTLAVARDLRWGRTYESFSEDPAVVESYSAGYVRGLQGALGDESVIACLKHWIGDGGTTEGNDQGDTVCTEDELRATHLRPYLPALEAGALTVMASFNSWNGEKCHGSRALLTDLLKGELGFDGMVVSDWDGADYLHPDYPTALAMAVNAGVDMIMVSADWRACWNGLMDQVERGVIPMARLDDAVRRVLSVKARYGLFERPRPAARPHVGTDAFGGDAHRAIAREAVRKSLVLLKNDAELLPLDRSARVLVAGRNADNRGHLCGGFTVEWQGTDGNDRIIGGTSIWEGIRAIAPHATLDVTGASANASAHDVAIVVIGEKPYAEGMGDIRRGGRVERGSGFSHKPHQLAPYGPSLELAELHPEDLAVVQRIAAAGIPVVTVLVSGRPLVTNAELDASQAFVAAWLPGSEGAGVADVLFGDAECTGQLPFHWPATTESGPSGSAARFPVGYGLRYSRARVTA